MIEERHRSDQAWIAQRLEADAALAGGAIGKDLTGQQQSAVGRLVSIVGREVQTVGGDRVTRFVLSSQKRKRAPNFAVQRAILYQTEKTRR